MRSLLVPMARLRTAKNQHMDGFVRARQPTLALVPADRGLTVHHPGRRKSPAERMRCPTAGPAQKSSCSASTWSAPRSFSRSAHARWPVRTKLLRGVLEEVNGHLEHRHGAGFTGSGGPPRDVSPTSPWAFTWTGLWGEEGSLQRLQHPRRLHCRAEIGPDRGRTKLARATAASGGSGRHA